MENNSQIEAVVAAGNAFDQKGDKLAAFKCYQEALRQSPKSIHALLNLSLVTYELDDLDSSEKYSLELLKISKKEPSALVNLGNIFYRRKLYKKALELYKKADLAKRGYYFAKINLANTYLYLKKYKVARKYALLAAKLNPRLSQPLVVLGTSYWEEGKTNKALDRFLAAQKLDSQNPWVHNYLSQIYQKKHLWVEALDSGLKAVDCSSGSNDHHISFGYLLYECLIEYSDSIAKKYAQKWHSKYRGNMLVSHVFSAIIGKSESAIAIEYVREVFDAFAPSFDETLKKLDYRVPKTISTFLKDFDHKKLSILDAGCGSGLCGKYLKKYAKKGYLDGVDLSLQMLQEASKKQCYDNLYHSDLEDFLSATKANYDLIVLSDVLTYFGDLEKLFSLVKKKLQKDGAVLFTISENNVNKRDFFLEASGRFLHTLEYVERVLRINNFIIKKVSRNKLRNEGDKEVFGFVILAIFQ